jgi:protein-disulfide isomerase
MEQREESITVKKHTMWQIGTFLFAALFVISLFTGGFGMSGGSVTGNAVAGDSVPSPEPSKVQVSIDDDAILGNKDAEVTMVEFSDYECPYCGRHFSQTYPQIKKEYVDTGKVRIVFRDFPLSFHPNAQKAAEAAECAGEQGKYYEMHDKLFTNQKALDVNSLKAYAQQIGLNIGKFNSCLDSGQMAGEIRKDMTDGQSYGVQGTPGFFVNGAFISGAQPYEVFKQAIDAELAK